MPPSSKLCSASFSASSRNMLSSFIVTASVNKILEIYDESMLNIWSFMDCRARVLSDAVGRRRANMY
jgi:hypothetical protein